MWNVLVEKQEHDEIHGLNTTNKYSYSFPIGEQTLMLACHWPGDGGWRPQTGPDGLNECDYDEDDKDCSNQIQTSFTSTNVKLR